MRWRILGLTVLLAVWLVSCERTNYAHHSAYMADGGVKIDVCTPLPEICDGVDNDCDGLVDNDDPGVIANDVGNCGECGKICNLQNVEIHTCDNGQCGIAKCVPGFSDLNEQAADGCESDCIKTAEYDFCDGTDNDCNGIVDDGFDLQNDPNNCGACDFRCTDVYDATTYHVASFSCQTGTCRIAACEPEWWDIDGLLEASSSASGS